ncbi:hypothetical protein [Acetonema longum]|uniref:Uncharacterized protein n=1 Tax=Acetonema longum DSM 6540 TaxID=1009370 RepID=F7NID9_9FIRM|nr:hypothetical protein [Acetonema longum]EGO64169.1 hypothetical protein ALO_09209 [Acetonema longum DSM 6540]
MWWMILKNMLDFLGQHESMTGVMVTAGAGVGEKACPAILLSWEQEINQLHGPIKGKSTLLIDECVESQDAAAGYAQLHDLQQRRQAVLETWRRENTLPFAVNIISRKTVRDPNSVLPEYGSRTTLEVEWKM